MTSEEQHLLSELLEQLKQIKQVSKDPEADALIKSAANHQPDSLYLLVQKTLLQDQALLQARTHIADLNRQLQLASSKSSFLSSDPWGNSRPSMNPMMSTSTYPGSSPQGVLNPANSPFSGFLGSALTTAAGVAGGALLFQGLEGLLGGHHGMGGSGYGFNDTAYQDSLRPENVTINEYYGSDQAPEVSDAQSTFTGLDDDYGSDDGDSNSGFDI